MLLRSLLIQKIPLLRSRPVLQILLLAIMRLRILEKHCLLKIKVEKMASKDFFREGEFAGESWSDERKAAAAGKIGAFFRQFRESFESRAQRKRIQVAADLSIAVAEKGMTRTQVAEKAGMNIAQLSRQLSGDVNLTLDSVGRICGALGYDFDIVLRDPRDSKAEQPWEGKLYYAHRTVNLFPYRRVKRDYSSANDDDLFIDYSSPNLVSC
ncbi:hypothetical protein C8235_06285 [Paracidovorax avenae]|nr:hypothetical protein C8235_06285 [Paracidovorax avenae]